MGESKEELTPVLVSYKMLGGTKFAWNDPDPQDSNNYTIDSIEYIIEDRLNPEAIVTIEYNGYLSTADVPVFELEEIEV